LDIVDPPEVRAQRQIDHENFRRRERNAMIDAGVALVRAANGEKTEKSSNDDNIDNQASEEFTKISHRVVMTNEEMLKRLQVATTRSKILHFLAVARIPKMVLVKDHLVLKNLLAAEDESGGVAPSPGIVRHLVSSADEEEDGVVDVRRLMPLLGWDSRVDMVTLERLPGFEEVDKIEEKVEEKIDPREGSADKKVEEIDVPRGNPVDVVRQLRENKCEIK
jgi:hypothetical protein